MTCYVCNHQFCWVCKLPRNHIFHNMGSAVGCEFVSLISDYTGKEHEHFCMRIFRNILLVLFFVLGPLVILILGLIFLYLSIIWQPIIFTYEIYKKNYTYHSYHIIAKILVCIMIYIITLIVYIILVLLGTVIAILVCIYAYIMLIVLAVRLLCLKCTSKRNKKYSTQEVEQIEKFLNDRKNYQ